MPCGRCARRGSRRRGRRAAAPRRGSASSAGSSCRARAASGRCSQAVRRAAGSKPVVGSSRKTSSGSPTSATPRSSRRFWPPESVLTRALALLVEPDELDHLVDVARPAVVAGEHPVHLAHGQRRRQLASAAARRRSARAAPGRRARVDAEHRDLAGVALRGSPRGSRPSSSCRRRSARAGRRPRRRATSKSIPRTASMPSYDFRSPRPGSHGRSRVELELGHAAGGNPRVAPVSSSAISEQSGWWPTVATGPSRPRERRRADPRSRRARCEPLVDARSTRPSPVAIASAVWRARTSGLVTTSRGGSAERARRSPSSARLLAALVRELAQLVRVAGRGLRMPAQVDAHRREHSRAPGRGMESRVTITGGAIEPRAAAGGTTTAAPSRREWNGSRAARSRDDADATAHTMGSAAVQASSARRDSEPDQSPKAR